MPSQQLDQIFQRFMSEYGRLVAADDQQKQDEVRTKLCLDMPLETHMNTANFPLRSLQCSWAA